MKPSAFRIERMLAKVEATLVPPPRKWLRVIIHERGDEAEAKAKALAEAKEKALAEHVALHPEDAGRTVEDFNWIVHEIVHVHQDPEMAAKMAAEGEEPLPIEGRGVRDANGSGGRNEDTSRTKP